VFRSLYVPDVETRDPRREEVPVDEFREQLRTMWSAGDYATLAEYISDVGEHVVARSEVGPGMRVLDVACGTGNAALPAARRGAVVTALDLVPELLEAGRAKAEAAGVEIEWVEGDAEELPFEDGAFDRVLSTFGHMFAPRHRRTADEMARVCKDGGTIAICCWTPDGTVGDFFRAASRYLPPAPDYASPPILWGAQEYVEEMFGSVAQSFEFERRDARLEWGSVEGFADFFSDRFGPLVTAKHLLGERFQELRGELIGIYEERNEAEDGSLSLPQEYLVSLIRL
jgi:SAM-dependent methyltransferase